MNQSKFEAAQRGLTTTARKVFGSVPIAEEWSPGQVRGEMLRQGINMDLRMVTGCLKSLIESGVVVEPNPGLFCRVPVRARPTAPTAQPTQPRPPVELTLVPPVTPKDPPMATPAPAAPASTPLDRLANLAARLRQATAMLTSIAADVENIALEIVEDNDRRDEEVKKLRQLQALLKSLG